MNRRIKQLELMKEALYLSSLKFDKKVEKSANAKDIIDIQNEKYKKFLFYKKLNEAMSRR